MAEIPSQLEDVLARAAEAPRSLSTGELAYLLSRESPQELDAIFAAVQEYLDSINSIILSIRDLRPRRRPLTPPRILYMRAVRDLHILALRRLEDYLILFKKRT